MKGLLRLFAPGDRCQPLADGTGKHLEKYRHFRDLLLANREALRQLAALEMQNHTTRALTTADIAYHYETLAGEVRRLVDSLNHLADHRYPALIGKLREIGDRVRPLLRPQVTVASLPPVLSLAAAAEVDATGLGGKAAHLAALADGGDLPVPPGFVVTASGYHLFLQANRLEQLVLDELATLAPDDSRLYEVSDRLVGLIESAEVPPELADQLLDHYHLLCRESGDQPLLAVRSSAVREDSEVSFAGQYRSLLKIPETGLLQAYKQVVASSFSPRAINYRRLNGIEASETPMAVLCLAMVEAEVSGVLYTADPAGRHGDALLVEALAGLGEALVDGSAKADSYLLERNGGRLLAHRPATADEQAPRPLAEAELARLAEVGLILERRFGGPQDIEWAIDRQGRLFLLQCRPLHVDTPRRESIPPPPGPPLIRHGEIASPGVAAGPLVFFGEGQRPADIPDGALVVTRTASPRLAEAMERMAGLICEVGSTMCHLASVARELGVPMAVNIPGAAALLAGHQTATLHAEDDLAIFSGLPADFPASGARRPRLAGGSMRRKLRTVLDHLSPLHLTDPDRADFSPEHCCSLHDIIRFAHEVGVREMFALSTLAEEGAAAQLSSHLPLELHLLDLGGGLAPGLTTCDRVLADHFRSQPLQALWRGFCHPGINWSGTMRIEQSGFLARLAASATAELGPQPGGASYALIAADYCNLSMKFGYHYAILDTLCGDDADHNYLSLQFSGGAGSYSGKTLRLQLLARILASLGCSLELQGDLLEAGLSRLPAEEMLDALDHIGRLLACSRLLDMAIANQEDVEVLAAQFLQGNYDLLGYSATRQTMPGFHTHLGTWRLVEEDGATCILADGARWLNPLTANLSGALGKVFGKAYQEFLDSIGAYQYFPMAVRRGGPCGDGWLSLAVKPLAGRIDQAGGLLFALRDIGNYLVLRLNALEHNLVLFEFVDNQRVERGRAEVVLASGRWYTLGVRLADNRIGCFLDGRELFAYRPERPPHGSTGLWSKADSVVLFKELPVPGDRAT